MPKPFFDKFAVIFIKDIELLLKYDIINEN